MLSINGASALSNFRQQKVLKALQAACPEVRDVAARYVHFVDLESALEPGEHAVLEKLLEYGPKLALRSLADANEFLSIPRLGTITPWSTKATDIARHCALDKVLRIERGIRWQMLL